MPTAPSIFDFTVPVTLIPNNDGIVGIELSQMPIDVKAARTPLMLPTYPRTFLAPLGAIIVQWGTFEIEHDEIMQALRLCNQSTTNVERSFKKRKELFKAEASIAFAGCPVLIKYVSDILGEAASLYIKRNVLAHGQLSCDIKITKEIGDLTIDNVEISIHGEGFNKGKPIEFAFTMSDLQKLFYAIAHIGGRIHELSCPEPSIPGLPLHEKSALQEFQRKGRLTAPNFSTQQPLP